MFCSILIRGATSKWYFRKINQLSSAQERLDKGNIRFRTNQEAVMIVLAWEIKEWDR